MHSFRALQQRRLGRKESQETTTMLEGKAMVEDTDMPVKMQLQAMSAAYKALDRFDVLDCRSIAAHIKKVGNHYHSHQTLATLIGQSKSKVLVFSFLHSSEKTEI